MPAEVEAKLNAESPASRRIYFDFDGNPIGLGTWARLFEDFPNRLIAQSQPTIYVRVSTIWIGVDYGWGSGPPIIYESMVFTADESSPWDKWCDRYATLRQAREGHERIVRSIGFDEDPHGWLPYLTDDQLDCGL